MKRNRFFLPAFVAILLAGGPAAATGVPFALSRTPDRPFALPNRVPAGDPDCSAAALLTLAPGDSLSLAGDTTGAPAAADAYGCVGWDESGPETVFAFQPTVPLVLHLRLAADPADLDLFLLAACAADSCVAYANRELVVQLAPRETPWYLVVDGYRGDAGPFTLQGAAYAPGPTAAACDSAVALTCDGGTTTTGGNLLDRDNRLVWNACASYAAWGGEQWFAVTVLDSAELTVTLSGQTFDGILWLFDGCGPDAACLAHADADLSGAEEQLTWQNLTGRRRTCWVGVDAAHPILSSEGATELDGQYQLAITCPGGVVATSPAGWGALKRRYR